MARRQLGLARRWRVVLLAVVLLLAMLVGGDFLVYRAVYHSFAFWSAPPQITYCNRDYQDDGTTLTRAETESQSVSLPGDSPYQLT